MDSVEVIARAMCRLRVTQNIECATLQLGQVAVDRAVENGFWVWLPHAKAILAALAANGQDYDSGVRDAAEKCLDVEWEEVGGPVKWKDIRQSFHHAIKGDVYNPALGIWNAATTTGGDASPSPDAGETP